MISSFLAELAAKLLIWIEGMIASAISRWEAMRVAKEKIEKANQQVLDETLAAKTQQERDDAAKDTISRF